MRLSIINLAGIARTDVAVGTEREASMLCTTRAATPRIGVKDAALGVIKVGIGFATGSAGIAIVDETSRTICCAGASGVDAAGVVASGATAAGVGVDAAGAAGTTGACTPLIEIFGGVTALGVGGVPPRGAPGVEEVVALLALGAPDCGLFWKYVTHSLGIEVGSDWYRSYISSTSQSFAPKSWPDCDTERSFALLQNL